MGSYHRGKNARSIHLLVPDSRLRTIIGKLNSERFKLEIRSKFLTQRVVKQWNSLPLGMMATRSLVAFKQRLDVHLFRMIWGFLPWAGNCSRRPKVLYSSVILWWFYFWMCWILSIRHIVLYNPSHLYSMHDLRM